MSLPVSAVASGEDRDRFRQFFLADRHGPASDGFVSGFDGIRLVSYGSVLENIERARELSVMSSRRRGL
jgi:hypothetical protein